MKVTSERSSLFTIFLRSPISVLSGISQVMRSMLNLRPRELSGSGEGGGTRILHPRQRKKSIPLWEITLCKSDVSTLH